MAKAAPGGTGKYRQGPGMRRFLRRKVLDLDAGGCRHAFSVRK